MLGLTFFSALLSFTIQLLPIRWGICAPKQCSEEDVTNALQDIFTGIKGGRASQHLDGFKR